MCPLAPDVVVGGEGAVEETHRQVDDGDVQKQHVLSAVQELGAATHNMDIVIAFISSTIIRP